MSSDIGSRNAASAGIGTEPRPKYIMWVACGTATSLIGGKLWQRDLVAYCGPDPGQSNGIVKVQVSDYPALQQSWGSVRLGLVPINQDGNDPFPQGDFFPILINRGDANRFYVLDSECQHQSCVVPPFDLSDGGIRCPCHGSRYWIDGSVFNGPTTAPLGTYPFDYDGQQLTIRIPCWAFAVEVKPLPPGLNSRIRVDFTARTNETYVVSSAPRPGGPWTAVSFATTPTGPTDQTSLTMTADSPASIYLARTRPAVLFGVAMNLATI